MTEALKFLIISVCLNCGDKQDTIEYIRIYTDSLIVAEQRWDITKTVQLDTYGDKVFSAIFKIRRGDLEGTITVADKFVYFTIPERDLNIALFQIQHTTEYYPPGEL